MKAAITSIWFDVTPESVMKGLKVPSLTMKPTCPLYNKDDWTDSKGNPAMMTAYSSLAPEYSDFSKLMTEETGLEILGYDTHYTLQVLINVSQYKGTIPQIQSKLSRFVAKYFEPYIPPAKA